MAIRSAETRQDLPCSNFPSVEARKLRSLEICLKQANARGDCDLWVYELYAAAVDPQFEWLSREESVRHVPGLRFRSSFPCSYDCPSGKLGLRVTPAAVQFNREWAVQLKLFLT